MSFQNAVSLIVVTSLLAAPQLSGQDRTAPRSRIRQLEVSRTELWRHLKGTSLVERARGRKVRIELRDGTVLNGRVKRIEHAENTSTLLLKIGGIKNPEPVPVEKIASIGYRGSPSKAAMAGVNLLMLPGAYAAEGATETGLWLFVGSFVGVQVLSLLLWVRRPHVVIRVVP